MMKSKVLCPITSIFVLLYLTSCTLGTKSESTPDIRATVAVAVSTAIKTEMSAPADTPTPDMQATIDAAVQATNQASQSVQATVDVAVQATVASMPTPTSVPPGGDAYYSTLSQEELAALIDQSVDEAMAASAQTTTATTEATTDGDVSDSDVETLQVYVNLSEQAIANAEALIAAYQDLYGDYASEYLQVLNEIEQDLAAIAQSTAQIAAILDQGAQAATQALEQLNDAAQTAQTKAAELQTMAQGRQEKLQDDFQKRLDEIKNLQPTTIATDRQGAIQDTFKYLDSLRNVLGGNKIAAQDIQQIAQLGVNASASIKAQGGPQLQRFSGDIDLLNQQMARGQYPQMKQDFTRIDSDFSSIGKRPGRK